MTVSDAETLRKYSRRVQIFHCYWDVHGVHASVLQALSFFFPDYLLPNLKRLDWWTRDPDAAAYIHLFLNPRITSVHLRLPNLNPVYASLVNSLPSLLPPNLCHFGLELDSDSDRVRISNLSACIGVWHHLRSLQISDTDLDGLRHISKLSSLRKLTLGPSIRQLNGINQENLGTITSPSPALRFLTIFGSPQTATRLFLLLRTAKLEKVVMESRLRESVSVPEWREFMESIGAFCDRTSLMCIRIIYPEMSLHDLTFPDIVAPLLQFSMLQDVEIQLPKPFGLSRHDTTKIKEAWPHISLLQFISYDVGFISHPANLSSLLLLASGCPNLRRLALFIDAWDPNDRADLFESLQKEPGLGACNPSLTILDVGVSLIAHKEFVATFLSEVFPNLKYIRSARPRNEPGNTLHHYRWQRIGRILLPMLRMTKKREHQRLAQSEGRIESIKVDEDDDDTIARLRSYWSREDSDLEAESDGYSVDDAFAYESSEESD